MSNLEEIAYFPLLDNLFPRISFAYACFHFLPERVAIAHIFSQLPTTFPLHIIMRKLKMEYQSSKESSILDQRVLKN